MTVDGQGSLFGERALRLEQKVYGSLKGRIRLELLQRDLLDFCPQFAQGDMKVLDIGGGTGRFSRICAGIGHDVMLLDASAEMLSRALKAIAGTPLEKRITLRHGNFLADPCSFGQKFDLVLLHGAAEWMTEPEEAILKACAQLAPGGYLSLLVFNRDRLTLKQGINGMLVGSRPRSLRSYANLTPPGAMTSETVHRVLQVAGGTLLLQSGIRIFYKFFREGVDESVLSPEEWLRQEIRYSREAPFNRLGEHSHFLYQAER